MNGTREEAAESGEHPGKNHEVNQELQRLWGWYGGSPVVETPWATFRVRPHNAPYGRVLAAAGLVWRYVGSGLLGGLDAVLRSDGKQPLAERLEVALGLSGQKSADAVVNVVLPFFHGWAAERGDERLAHLCQEAYAGYRPLASNQTIREMQGMLLEHGKERGVVNTTRRQGLLRLYKKRCAELLCSGCAFGMAGGDFTLPN